MRIVFMGTPAFSATILKALAGDHEVVAVYTRPDSVSGRGSKQSPSATRVVADELGIPVYTPRNLREPDEVARLSGLAPDCIVVAAYGVILPADVLDIPRFGCVNVHASLLPRWRGAAPLQRAILAGDQACGVCIMRMEEGLDTGDYCSCVSTLVDHKDTDSLTAELAQMGAAALLRALAKIQTGTADWKAQDDASATYAGKVSKDEVLIDPSLAAVECDRRVRASSDTAPSRTVIAGKPLRVLEAVLSDEVLQPGEVSCPGKRLILGCAEGSIEVLRLKPDGKTAMDVQAWMAGLHMKAGNWEGTR